MLWRVLIVISVLALAGPAAAGDAKCLWDHLPRSARDGYLLAGVKDPAADPMSVFTNAQIAIAIDACKVSDAALGSAAKAFSGFSRQLVAERRLAILADVYPEDLDHAWSRIDPALIGGLAKEVEDGSDPTMGLKVWHALVGRLTTSASDPQALRQELIGYMSSRATRQTNEALY